MGQSRTGLDVQVGGLKAGGAGVSSSGLPVGGLSMYRSGLPWRIYNGISTWLDRRFGWDKFPVPLSLAVLVGLRRELRRRNLYDSNLLPSGTLLELPDPREDYSVRTVDGSYNDLAAPRAARAGLGSAAPFRSPASTRTRKRRCWSRADARSVKGCKESPMSLSSPNRSSGLSHCTHERRRND